MKKYKITLKPKLEIEEVTNYEPSFTIEELKNINKLINSVIKNK